ncbi:MAG: radical SAM protein [Candidatus Omnitrophica bacterium]|nr:radical SAM protein [Candidatus Omnitrophota bacterium]
MSKKKILFVYPSSYDSKNCLIKSKYSFVPSRTLPYLAALTPARYEARIIDELVDELNFDEDVDLVALTGMLRHIPRAIDIAKEFRKRGVPSIIGGVGAFSVHDMVEKSGVFESFVSGEVDETWEGILDDFEKGRLRRRYECATPPQLSGLPHARFDLLNHKKYLGSFVSAKNPLVLIETSRGCPHNCRFCLVTRYFGKKMRYRPIGEVVDEIKHYGAKHIMFTDDNIVINPERAKELFQAIKPLGIQWLGQFESRMIKSPELLRLAAESGCRTAFVGIESIDKNNLISMDKHQSSKLDFKDIVNGFKEAGIDLFASLIFGMDHDTAQIIDRTIEQSIELNIDAIIPWVLTPVPGTACYDDFKKDNRLVHENYSLYDAWHLVIRPKQMSPDEFEKHYWQGLKRFYSLRSILLRAWRGKKLNMSWIICSLYFHQQVKKGLHPFAGGS